MSCFFSQRLDFNEKTDSDNLRLTRRVGWDRGLGYSPGPHSPRFREFRRLFNEFIGRRQTEKPYLLSAQEDSALKLTRRLLREPASFLRHVRL